MKPQSRRALGALIATPGGLALGWLLGVAFRYILTGAGVESGRVLVAVGVSFAGLLAGALTAFPEQAAAMAEAME